MNKLSGELISENDNFIFVVFRGFSKFPKNCKSRREVIKVLESMPKTALNFQVLPGQSTEYSPGKTYGDQSKTVSH